MLQKRASNGREALNAVMAKSSLHTGLMLTEGLDLHAEAMLHLQKAVSLDPDFVPAIEALARICLKRAAMLDRDDNLVAAENCLRKALTLGVDLNATSKELAALLEKRALEFLNTGRRLYAAESFLREALELQPDNNETRALLVSVMEAQKTETESDDANLEFLAKEEARLRSDPPPPSESPEDAGPLLVNLSLQAVHLFQIGRVAEAECAFRKCLALRPLPSLIDSLITTLCYGASNSFDTLSFSDAETALWEALAWQPENAGAANILGQITGTVSRYVHNIMDPEYGNCMQKLVQALHVKDVINATYVRKGGEGDGGYVMVDHGLDNAIVYSLGIGNNVSWDLDMAARGCQIFQYDHTIDQLPIQHENFHWSKLGIAGTEQPDENYSTLDHLISLNGHKDRNDLILKVDIESFEWSMFAEMNEEVLSQFSQIVGEFHRLARIIDPLYRETMFAALDKINKYFQLVHVHANNFTGMVVISGTPVYHCMELTFVRRADHTFADTQKVFPTPMDFPCNPKLADLFLGRFGG